MKKLYQEPETIFGFAMVIALMIGALIFPAF
jgi:hypothetical protein